MPTWVVVVGVLAVWVLAGLVAVVVLLGRQGYRAPQWYFLGAALGPLFIPIAAERAGREVTVVQRRPAPAGERPAGGGPKVVVGVDGSPESDRAVEDAVRLFGPRGARFVLVAVVGADEDWGERDQRRVATDLLASRAERLPGNGPAPVLEIVSGQPARGVLAVAAAEGADVVVLGRRGRGLSRRLLGSVAQSATEQCAVPVLLAGRAAG